LSDADFLPTCKVFEDDTDTAILSPTVVKRVGYTGSYRVLVAATALNGFEVGKTYNVHVNATVNGISAESVRDTFTLEENNLDDIADAIAAVPAAVAAIIVGDGDFSVYNYVRDGEGIVVSPASITIPGVGTQQVNGAGRTMFAWGLQEGVYADITVRAGIGYVPENPYTMLVAADGSVISPTGGVFAVEAVGIPVAPDPDNYALYNNERKVEGDLPLTSMLVKIVGVADAGRTDVQAEAQRSAVGTETTVNSQGQWSIEIAKALKGCSVILEKIWNMADGYTLKTEQWQAAIDGKVADEWDRMPWAELLPERIR